MQTRWQVVSTVLVAPDQHMVLTDTENIRKSDKKIPVSLTDVTEQKKEKTIIEK